MAEGCALVTGSARGIGAASAQALADAGWPVAINYRSDAAGAEGVAEAIGEAGGQAAARPGRRLRPRTPWARSSSRSRSASGPVLVLVNNAGMRADGLAPQLGDDEWERVLETNLSAAFRVTRRALKPDDPRPLRPRDQHRLDRRPARERRAGQLRRLQGRA